MAPFGATCVLLFAAPAAPLAQPRNVIGGHLISALVGMVILHLFGTGLWQMAVGVGVAIALMQLLRAVHPPAGANPLVVLTAGVEDWSFLITPVLVGSVILVLIALFINNVGTEKRWPHYWI
ncbi:HPP family protein [Halomonas sp. McH1-25]|nr:MULTISPECIES: HPP family protein [unclassified Halomonas]MCG7601576.1 HPP family protein [Halomonas sp. McH1-25]MCP1343153.1 HPP family protein [Halomonas sp. FL8]MCP1360964.1 HPP family protein [Halomonas sp. BBD45]MCP1364079.1 HPP family protein [Halomonas sp. BBD48]